jgi:hypothetical protein
VVRHDLAAGAEDEIEHRAMGGPASEDIDGRTASIGVYVPAEDDGVAEDERRASSRVRIAADGEVPRRDCGDDAVQVPAHAHRPLVRKLRGRERSSPMAVGSLAGAM